MKNRREVLKGLIALPLIATNLPAFAEKKDSALSETKCYQLKTSLNAFCFNDPLLAGKMNLDEVIEFCAEQHFDAIDITGYYFPGYPDVPSDEYIYHIKRKVFLSGLEISGSGVRNDFTDPDPLKRKSSVQLVKNWIEVAQKLGAPVIRIFAGIQAPAGYTWNQVAEWMMKDIKECIEFGKQHGIIVAIQNHHDLIRTAGDVIKIMKMADSEWFGLIMDTGGYREGDPYQQIEETIQYAVNWQIKEKIFVDGVEQDSDLSKLIAIIKKSCYKGYLPIETLGAGDPKLKVINLMEKLRKVLYGQ
ncbi:MAG: sugar phosphate isomerase/epimerase family protein [Ginsengibacter sp.]